MFPDDPYAEIQILVAGLPDSVRTVVAKSREFRARDADDLAFALLERASERHAAPRIMAERASLLAAHGRQDEALDLALRAAIEDPMSPPVFTALTEILVDLLPDGTEILLSVAGVFIDEDEPGFAEDLIRSAVERYPANAELRLYLAKFYARYARTAESVLELRALLRNVPVHPEAHVMLAASMFEEGDVAGAKHWLEKAKALGAESKLATALDARLNEPSGK